MRFNKKKSYDNQSTKVRNYNKFLASLDSKSKQNQNMENIVPIHIILPDKLPGKFYIHSCPTIKKISTNTKKQVITIDKDINSIDDLLSLIETYKLVDENKQPIDYNINMQALHNIQTSLLELNRMIGMKELKMNIIDQILYFIQGFNSGDFMHTVIYGPPGTGKTEIAKIMGDIFAKIGLLKNGTFRKVTRSDLVSGYLGQTALKTKDVIKDCLGGVLFIDEAYSLGNTEKRDSFSKECIDTLCEALSAHKHELMVIVAGYEKELNECFFNHNQGLNSRFTWRFNTDKYTSKDLYQIFTKKVQDIQWSISVNAELFNENWFHNKMSYFTFFGRDMETLLAKTKIVHSRRVFCKCVEEKKVLTLDDLNKGFQQFIKNDDVKKRPDLDENKRQLQSIYI